MKMPVALQTALERSERQFQQVLSRLGLTRDKLAGVAEKIRTRTETKPPARPAACVKRRVIHV